MNTENREIMPGETMFDYLKRKKKFILEKTLNRGKGNREPLHQQSINSSPFDYDKTRRDDQREKSQRQTSRDRTRRDQPKDSYKSTQRQRNESITVRRNNIIQQEKKPLSRSFIQMISPIRSKSPARQIEKSSSKDAVTFKKESKENYTKKVLTDNIKTMRDTIESQLRAGKNLKEKAHSLFLELKPFFRHIENCSQSGLERRTEEIKGKIRALQSIFKEFNTDDHKGSIDEFYMNFSQYLNQLEGQAKAEISENKDSLTNEISRTKNREIEELNDQNMKLRRQLTLISKKYEKLQKSYQELTEKAQLRSQQRQSNYQDRIIKLQNEINLFKDKNYELQEELQRYKGSNSKLQQERKHLLSQRQRFEEQCLSTITKVKSEQQEFLLNQIMVLKKEFNVDLSKMAELYKIKEADLLNRVTEREIEMGKLQKLIEDMMQTNKKLEQSMTVVQSQSMRIKKQNQCLAIDMHRINQELYQHWLALKDIKILSQRLDIFQKFKKIYDQLLFNEQLFL